MNKIDFVEIIAERVNLNKLEAGQVFECILSAMRQALKEGKRIEIRGLGTFGVRTRRPRMGRNPRTGEKVSVPSKKVPFFKPGKEFKIIEVVDE
ncbi:MAG: integration host factor subunit beta [bacterium]|nr:integration host factor subunit beta [bacterium]